MHIYFLILVMIKLKIVNRRSTGNKYAREH